MFQTKTWRVWSMDDHRLWKWQEVEVIGSWSDRKLKVVKGKWWEVECWVSFLALTMQQLGRFTTRSIHNLVDWFTTWLIRDWFFSSSLTALTRLLLGRIRWLEAKCWDDHHLVSAASLSLKGERGWKERNVNKEKWREKESEERRKSGERWEPVCEKSCLPFRPDFSVLNLLSFLLLIRWFSSSPFPSPSPSQQQLHLNFPLHFSPLLRTYDRWSQQSLTVVSFLVVSFLVVS